MGSSSNYSIDLIMVNQIRTSSLKTSMSVILSFHYLIYGHSAFFPIFSSYPDFPLGDPRLLTKNKMDFPIFDSYPHFPPGDPRLLTKNKMVFPIFGRRRDFQYNDSIWLTMWGLRSEDVGDLSHSHDFDCRQITILW